MNMKSIATACLMLGVLMLALSAYQMNQYLTTQPLVKQSLKGFEALAAQGDSAEIQQAKESITEISNVYLQTAGIDFVLGAVLVFLGVMFSPKERERGM